MNNFDEQAVKNAVNTAHQVFSAEDCAKIEKLLSDKNATQAILSKLSEKDLNSVATVMNDPNLLKKVLSSPKASESLKRILEGFHG